MTKPRLPVITGRKCAHCGKAIGKSKRASAKYCSHQCKGNASQSRQREKLSVEIRAHAEAEKDMSPTRRGTTLTRMTDLGYPQMVADGTMTVQAAAELLHVTPAAVSRAMGAWRIEEAKRVIQGEWVISDEAARLAPTDLWLEFRDLGFVAEGTDLYGSKLDALAEAFWKFEHRYFTIGSEQDSFIRKPFHSEIIREFIVAQAFGMRVLVLTPPRHGKSELVIRFCAWLIMMFPNIQVLWVAATTKLAVSMTRKLKATFEHNKTLIEDFLPPGKKFGDDKAPKWTEEEFTLYTRTDPTLKSSTFTAVGSTATVAGRDADFIGIDDLEEQKTVRTPEMRRKSKVKHSEIMERQEHRTGVVTIASRQHPDDIPNALMQQHGPKAWRVHSYPAHDEDCELDDDVVVGHDESGCVLFPEIRPYADLLNIRDETEALGVPGRYELRFLQKSIPVDGMVFDIKLIREQCLDRSRTIGDQELPEGLRLIAGMDPAPRGIQAAVLWGWTPTVTYLIDLEARKGAGQEGAVQLFYEWHEKYGLTHWVYEDNMAKQDFFTRPDVKEAKNRLGLTIEKHTTGNNKHDAEVGISSMAPWYHTGRFNLPYGNTESVRKVKELLGQLELWTTDGLIRGATVTDIKMASWLPFVRRLVKWSQESRGDLKLELTSNQSYPDIESMNVAPWHTMYPGET